MKYKNYKDEELDGNFGVVVSSGKPSYEDMQEVKEVLINDKWVANSGYDLAAVKTNLISPIDDSLIKLTQDKATATSLSLTSKVSELQTQIDELLIEKTSIESL